METMLATPLILCVVQIGIPVWMLRKPDSVDPTTTPTPTTTGIISINKNTAHVGGGWGGWGTSCLPELYREPCCIDLPPCQKSAEFGDSVSGATK